MAPEDPELEALVARSRDGDEEALGALVGRMHDELRDLARALMQRERPGHTLQPTALVHEAYLKLARGSSTPWTDRRHFFAICARAMRQILIGHAERHRTAKRGGGKRRRSLDEASVETALLGGVSASSLIDGTPTPAIESAWRLYEERSLDLLALDEALEELATLDERQARVVELRFFGGLSIPETAEVLATSESTVERDWSLARAWLRLRLRSEEDRS